MFDWWLQRAIFHLIGFELVRAGYSRTPEACGLKGVKEVKVPLEAC